LSIIGQGLLNTDPVELPTISFIPVKKYKESFPLFGQLYDDYTIPGNCEATGIPAQAYVGNKVDFNIIAKNCKNICCVKGGSDIIAQVQSSNGDVVLVEVKDNDDRNYSASFVIKQVGEVKLLITIEGQHIKGSPYSVMVC